MWCLDSEIEGKPCLRFSTPRQARRAINCVRSEKIAEIGNLLIYDVFENSIHHALA